MSENAFRAIAAPPPTARRCTPLNSLVCVFFFSLSFSGDDSLLRAARKSRCVCFTGSLLLSQMQLRVPRADVIQSKPFQPDEYTHTSASGCARLSFSSCHSSPLTTTASCVFVSRPFRTASAHYPHVSHNTACANSLASAAQAWYDGRYLRVSCHTSRLREVQLGARASHTDLALATASATHSPRPSPARRRAATRCSSPRGRCCTAPFARTSRSP